MSFAISLPSLTPRHRHALALPVALVLAMLPLADVAAPPSPPVTASVTWSADDAERSIALDSGRIVVFPGGSLQQDGDAFLLEEGSALLIADDVLRVRAGEWRVTILDGAVHLTRHGNMLTIAAVTTAATVQRADTRSVVPQGMQWTSTGTVASLGDGIDAWADARTFLPLPEDFVLDQVQRITAQTFTMRHEGIMHAALADMVAGFPVLTAATDTWLLAALHPRTAGLAWIADPPADASIDDRLTRLFVMPLADTRRDPFPDIAVDRWFADVAQIVPAISEPDRALLRILRVVRTAAATAALRGQPERALRYRQLSDRLLQHFSLVLTEDQIRSLPDATVTSAQTITEDLPVQDAPEIRDASPQMIADTRQALLSIGALFTSQTRMQDIDGNVRITGIGFATPAGDTLFDMTLNLDTLTVWDIRRNGETFVNPVTLEQFAAWVGK